MRLLCAFGKGQLPNKDWYPPYLLCASKAKHRGRLRVGDGEGSRTVPEGREYGL